MNPLTVRQAANVSLSVALVSLALVGVDRQIGEYIPISATIFKWLLYIGIYLLIAAIALHAISLVLFIKPKEGEFTYRPIKRPDLKELHKFLKKTLGDDIMSERGMRSFYDKNQQVFWGVYEESASFSGKKISLIGHFSIGPITAETKKLLISKKLTGKDFTPENLVTPRQPPAGYYIGAIAAIDNRKARAETISSLMKFLLERTARKSPYVFTRPITADGLRLARKYGFKTVDTSEDPVLDALCIKDFSKPCDDDQ